MRILSYYPPTPPDMRVRIRRFETLRFPGPADLSAVVRSSPPVPSPRFAAPLGFTRWFPRANFTSSTTLAAISHITHATYPPAPHAQPAAVEHMRIDHRVLTSVRSINS